MKNLLLLITIIICSLTVTTTAMATGNVNGYIGFKFLEEDDWAPVEDHVEFGVMFDFAPSKDFPVNFAIDLLVSVGAEDDYYDTFSGSYVDIYGYTSELALGVRKYLAPRDSKINPYIGFGLALIYAEYETEFGFITISDDDNAAGIWIDGGVLWTFKHFNIGFDVRYSDAEVTLFGIDAEAGGFHTGAVVGYHW